MLTALRALVLILASAVVLPISFYLQFKILQAVNATDLMWFLFWAYVPALLVMQAVGAIIKPATDE